MKKEFIDNMVKNSLENMKVKPEANWQSFQKSYLNNTYKVELNQDIANFSNTSSKFIQFLTSKLTIISTVVLTTVGTTILLTNNNNTNNTAVSQSIVSKEFTKTETKRQVIIEQEPVDEKNIQKSENTISENNQLTTKAEETEEITGDIIDTVKVGVKQDVVIKKVIVKKDTLIIKDTIKVN